jgi:hypothetical protein
MYIIFMITVMELAGIKYVQSEKFWFQDVTM